MEIMNCFCRNSNLNSRECIAAEHMQWKGMLGSLSDLLGNLTLPMIEPPPAAQALCFVRTLLAMPPGCTSPPNTLSIPFGPSLQPLSQPSRSSIKPCHLSQCSDFMALIFLMIRCVISQERCTLESDDINTWPLFAYDLIVVSRSRHLCNRNTFPLVQWLFCLMLDFVFRMTGGIFVGRTAVVLPRLVFSFRFFF